MVRTLIYSLALAFLLGGCRKDEEVQDTSPYWILNITVRDGAFPNREIPECAHVLWTYAGQFDTHDDACRNANGFVKVDDKITEDVRIFYHVECTGYTPSVEYQADFAYALVDTLVDGFEVIQSVTISIYPE